MNRLNCTYPLSDYLPKPLFLVISVVITLAIFFYIFKNHKTIEALVALTAIFSGGLQNMLERIMYNCVVDNINFFGLFVYNIADFMITSGVILLIYSLFTAEESSDLLHRK